MHYSHTGGMFLYQTVLSPSSVLFINLQTFYFLWRDKAGQVHPSKPNPSEHQCQSWDGGERCEMMWCFKWKRYDLLPDVLMWASPVWSSWKDHTHTKKYPIRLTLALVRLSMGNPLLTQNLTDQTGKIQNVAWTVSGTSYLGRFDLLNPFTTIQLPTAASIHNSGFSHCEKIKSKKKS